MEHKFEHKFYFQQHFANRESGARKLFIFKMIQYQNRRFLCLTSIALKKFVTFSWQTGHSFTVGAQASQQARCPQGERPMATFSSRQILHVSWFRRFMFSSFSALSSVKKIFLLFIFFKIFILLLLYV